MEGKVLPLKPLIAGTRASLDIWTSIMFVEEMQSVGCCGPLGTSLDARSARGCIEGKVGGNWRGVPIPRRCCFPHSSVYLVSRNLSFLCYRVLCPWILLAKVPAFAFLVLRIDVVA